MSRDLGFAVEPSQARFLATVLAKYKGGQTKKLVTRKLVASLYFCCLETLHCL